MMDQEQDQPEKIKLDRNTLLAEIRKAADECKGGALTRNKFRLISKLPTDAIYKYFATWKDALGAAGIQWRRHSTPADDLISSWADCVRKLGRLPSQNEYDGMSGICRSQIFTRRFGSWHRLPDAFREFAEGKEEWADVLALLPPPGACVKHTPCVTRPGRPRLDERIYGPPIVFKNTRHAPVNELGVVCLFGAMSDDLGFIIESIQTGFPDCVAKRRIGGDKWQLQRIEFEYESRNFRDHDHPADGCDVIVCWEHNWEECPPHLEVIALKDELERISLGPA